MSAMCLIEGNIGKNEFLCPAESGAQGAFRAVMSSYEPIHKKTASLLKTDGAANWREPDPTFDPTRHVAPAVAHELNNILTIVQGYADRLLLRHAENPELMPNLKMISEAAKRAAAVVRKATPPNANDSFRQRSQPASVAA